MRNKPHPPDRWEALRQKANALPESPGVYLYKDGGGSVIYVGKAKSLRDRVRNYFLEERLAEVKTGRSQPAQTNTPSRFSAFSGLVPARSVPSLRSTS